MIGHAVGCGSNFGFDGIGNGVPPQIAERSPGNRLDAVAIPNVKRARRSAIEEIEVKAHARLKIGWRIGGIAAAQGKAAPAMDCSPGSNRAAGFSGAPLNLEGISS